MSKLKVNVIIAGRTYPLSVKDTQEEEGLRKAGKNINDLIMKFEQNYEVADKQDVLAMCALQFASKAEIASVKADNNTEKATKKIEELNDILKKYL